MALTVTVSWGRRSLANPQEDVKGSQKGNEETAVASGAVTSLRGAQGGAELLVREEQSTKGWLGAAQTPHNAV